MATVWVLITRWERFLHAHIRSSDVVLADLFG